jgi:hypothetical protein
MNKRIHGKVHGRTVDLDEDPGLPDGQEVQVALEPVQPQRPWGEGIRRSAGALADSWTDEDDRILEEIHRDRKRPSHREIPE